jgi:hypothetical protein
MKKLITSVLLVSLVTAACGGASKPAQAPEHGPSGDLEKTSTAPGEPSPQPQAPGGAGASPREAALKKAVSDLETSQRELEQSGTDCKSACRALGSMDRAAGHLCEMSQTSDEKNRCEEAKVKLYSAREKVRTACTTCGPGGPSVEKNAPVPSVR